MKCPNCQRENESTSRFCIFCGAILPADETEQPSKPVESNTDTLIQQIPKLQQEVRRLSALVALMNSRIVDLERARGISVPSAEPTPVTTPEPTQEPVVAAIPTKEAKLTTEVWESPLAEAPPPPTREKRPTIAPPSAKERHPPSAIQKEWEQILGGNWLARVGVLLLVIGVGFFLKFAFDQNWLGPTARVILGVVAGLGMLLGGHYWQKRYPIFAQAISGGGVALLYLCIFAAFAMFGLIAFYLSVVLLLILSVGSALLAIRYNSMALAILGIIGAFLAPFILAVPVSRVSGVAQTTQSFWLLVYTMVVDIGVLWLSTFRNWRWFTLLALVCSLSIFGMWYGRFGDQVSLLTSTGSLTLIFLIFVGATMFYHLLWRRVPQALDYLLMVVNAAAYYGISYYLLWYDLRAFLGSFSFLMALFYTGLAYLARKRSAENLRLTFYALGIALVFLTVAIPAQLGDKAWTTIAWATEGTVLMWLSLRLRMPQLRVGSYLVFVATAVRLLFFDTRVDLTTFTPMLNERFLAFLVSIAAMYLASYLLWRQRDALLEWEENIGSIYPIFLVVADLFSLWVIGAEVISYTLSPLTPQEGWPLAFLVLLAGAITLYHIVWRRPDRVFDLVLLILNAVFYFGISGLVWGDFRAWIGSIYFLLAFFYGILAYVAIRRGTENVKLGLFALVISVVFFTVAIPTQLGDKAWTTIAWAAEGTALVWLSFRLRLPLLRICSYFVFVATAVRLLFFDTGVDLATFTPVLNERFLAFLVSIAAMYLTGYIMRRERESLWEREKSVWSVYPVFLGLANFFSIWLLSVELWGYFTKQLANAVSQEQSKLVIDGLRSARNLSLTALWAIYAMILLVVGIIRRLRMVRIAALGLITIPIIKVFVYDVFALEQVYRIIAFVGLGILLIAGGYLYQRYRKAIAGFLVKE
jgi:uncharacterized membrane protein